MGGIDLCFGVLYHLCCVKPFSACNIKKFLANSRLNINVVSKLCIIQVFTFPFVKFLDHKRLKYISDEINHHLIVLNQIGTLDEPRFNHLCEDAVKTAKELSDELTEKLDIEIEKSKVVKA